MRCSAQAQTRDRDSDEVGAEFVEVVLLSDPQDAAALRSTLGQPETAEHRDVGVLLDRSGGVDALPEMYDLLPKMVASRPGTRIVVTVDGRVKQAYDDLLGQVST